MIWQVRKCTLTQKSLQIMHSQSFRQSSTSNIYINLGPKDFGEKSGARPKQEAFVEGHFKQQASQLATYSPLAAVLFCVPYDIYPVNEFDFLFVTEKLGSKHLAAAKSMHLVHLSSLQSIYFFREREILEMHFPSACKPHSRHFVGNIILEFGISLSTVFSSCRQLPLL